MLFRLLLLSVLLSTPTLLCAQENQSREYILLISQPKVWSAPRPEAKGRTARLTPGARIRVLETKTATSGEVSPSGTWYRVETGSISGWMPDAYLAPPPQKIEASELNVIGTELVDRFHGIAPEYQPADLVPVAPLYDQAVKSKMRREAAAALQRMVSAAQRDGVKLLVVSGYRAWSKQQDLYENKVKGTGIDQNTVAKPGHSEHQLGVAVDLSDGDESTLLRESFGETASGKWLHDHAWVYGFAISFTRHNQPQTGCAPEPWHYRYWGPNLAKTKHYEHLGEKP